MGGPCSDVACTYALGTAAGQTEKVFNSSQAVATQQFSRVSTPAEIAPRLAESIVKSGTTPLRWRLPTTRSRSDVAVAPGTRFQPARHRQSLDCPVRSARTQGGTFFYPRDNTPGCSSEAAAFREHHQDFVEAGCTVLGISRDSLRSHARFRERLALPFDLVSDPEEKACSAFQVMKDKNMYGRQVRGIERSTFPIDENGRITDSWRKVKVAGHVEQVLEALQCLATKQ